jgi:nucleotide-binding universal stress UspA family protein
MRIAIAVDWNDQSFSAVKETIELFAPDDVILLHVVDLGVLEYPNLAPAMAESVYQDLRKAMTEAGRQLLDRTAELIPSTVPSVRKLCESGSPVRVILETLRTAQPDLAVFGARGRGRIAELIFGSISHAVLSESPCAVLIVKGPARRIERVLIAVEGSRDAQAIQDWLLAHPFAHRLTATVMTVAPNLYLGDPEAVAGYQAWGVSAFTGAQDVARRTAAALDGPHFAATGRAHRGEPVELLVNEAANYDLVVVGTHGRKGMDRWLLGSVSHALAHGVGCPVLVVR